MKTSAATATARSGRSTIGRPARGQSLADRFPDVAAEWDAVANDGLTPCTVGASSRKLYRWICRLDPTHRWAASISNRTYKGTGCPVCPRKPGPGQSLAERMPQLAAEWDAAANGCLTPEAVFVSSSRRAYWICSTDPTHRWASVIALRTAGDRCPFCTNRRVSSTNNLAVRFPVIAAEWDYDANHGLTPDQVMPGTLRRVAWVCPNGPDHRWVSTVTSRASSNKSGCPMCAGIRVSSSNNLAERFPDIAAEWDYDANHGLTPDQVMPGSNRKLIAWVCAADPSHRWIATANSRTSTYKSGCPMCSGRRVSGSNNLAVRFPELAAQWDYDANQDLTPDQIVSGTQRRIAWICPNGPDHRWVSTGASRTGSNKSGCPMCAGRRVSSSNNLAARFPELAAQWDYDANHDLTPDQVMPGSSSKKIAWICPANSDHRWMASAYSRTQGSGCPQCRRNPRKPPGVR